MRIAITGASGMIGSELRTHLAAAGDVVVPLVRERPAAADSGALYWNPASGEIDAAEIVGHKILSDTTIPSLTNTEM